MPKRLEEKGREGGVEKDVQLVVHTLPLHLAAVVGNTDMVRLLLKVWPDATSEKAFCGNTPLHLAAEEGYCSER
jgi:ankyrin repeat protein